MSAPLYYCNGCARELRRDSCRKCGTFGNTATNEIIDVRPKVCLERHGRKLCMNRLPCPLHRPECHCKPCRTCGMKHICDAMQPHPGGWVRCGDCPAQKSRVGR